MIVDLILSLYLNLKPWEKAKPMVAENTKAGNISLEWYREIPLKPELKAVTFKLASAKVVSPKTVAKPIPVYLAPENLQALFEKYGNQYGVSSEMLAKIAKCESGFRANAVNGPYAGMFQFSSSTWVANRAAMGENPDPDLRFNAEEAIKTTAFKIARDGTGAWPVCGK